MRAVFITIALLATANVLAGPPVVKKATPEANATAKSRLESAFASRDALLHAGLFGKVLCVGPRLWAVSGDERLQWAQSTKAAYGVVDQSVAAQWNLVVPDVSTLPSDVRPALSTLLQSRSGSVPIITGAIVGHTQEIATSLLNGIVAEDEFPFSVRSLTESELGYYWAIIPYDIEEPIWAVTSSSHTFLCHFGDEELFYVELL